MNNAMPPAPLIDTLTEIRPAREREAAVASGTTVILLCASLACISMAMPLHGGRYGRDAIGWMIAGLVANLLAFAGWSVAPIGRFARPNITAICGLCVAVQGVLLLSYRPGAYLLDPRYEGVQPAMIWLGILVVLAVSSMADRPWFGRLHKPLLLAAFAACALWVFRHSPNPPIDTFVIHQESSQALLAGKNPYAEHLTNIYGMDTPYLPNAFVTPDKLLFGYTYPPVSLLIGTAGYALTHDHRHALLGALLLAAGLLVYIRPGKMPLLAGAILLTFSRSFELLESSWTEPVVVLLLMATLFSAARRSRWTPWLFGLLLISKQHLILAAPLGLMLVASPVSMRSAIRFYVRSAVVVMLVVTPFVLWNPGAFVTSVIKVHLALAPREDSLSLATLFGASNWQGAALLAALAGLAGVYVIAGWRRLHGPGAFAMTLASAGFVFFMFGKGFMNYYYLVSAATCAVLALSPDFKDLPARSIVAESMAAESLAKPVR